MTMNDEMDNLQPIEGFPVATSLMQIFMIANGMNFEIATGLKMSRGPKCSTMARKRLGLKGSPEKLLAQVCDIYDQLTGETESTARFRREAAARQVSK
jgi:hypothetical protein